jgi:hypothetical protein
MQHDKPIWKNAVLRLCYMAEIVGCYKWVYNMDFLWLDKD